MGSIVKNEKTPLIALIIFLLSLVVYQYFAQKRSDFWLPDFRPGDRAIEFNANDLKRVTWKIPEKGKSYILIFLDPECGSCKKSLPYLNSIYDSLAHTKLNIVGILISDRETASVYSDEHHIIFPIIPDKDKRIARKPNSLYTPNHCDR